MSVSHDFDELSRTVYDRQIRLWGHATQRRLAALTVTLIGELRTLAYECAKNLALAGVGRICILNTESDAEKNREQIEWMREQIEALNPAVKFSQVLESSGDNEEQTLDDLLADNECRNSLLIIFTDLKLSKLKQFSATARDNGVAAIDVRVGGLCGMAVFSTKCYYSAEPIRNDTEDKSEPTIYDLISTGEINTGSAVTGFSPQSKLTNVHLIVFLANLLTQTQKGKAMVDLQPVMRRLRQAEECLDSRLLDSQDEMMALHSRNSPCAPEFLPVSSVVAGFVVSEITRLLKDENYSHVNNTAFYTSDYLNGKILQLTAT